jgi:hypothetical protein
MACMAKARDVVMRVPTIVIGRQIMNQLKPIKVVAPEKYKALARIICHEMSKNPSCTSAFWTLKQFEDNESISPGNSYALFVGNPDENSLTKDFLPIIEPLTDTSGACFGFDGPRAVIFGRGDLDEESSFLEAWRSFDLPFSVWDFIFPYFGIGKLFSRKARDSEREHRLLNYQTKFAWHQFFETEFQDWIAPKE